MTLSSVLSKLASLQSLTFSDCGLSERSVNQVCCGILQGIKTSTVPDCKLLVSLDFSGNTLKDVSTIYNLIHDDLI